MNEKYVKLVQALKKWKQDMWMKT